MSNLKHPLVLWLIFKKQYSAESASALQKYTFTQIFFFFDTVNLQPQIKCDLLRFKIIEQK